MDGRLPDDQLARLAGGGDPSAGLDRVEADLGAVEVALAGLDDRSYGTCEQCGTRLDDVLLDAEPLARRCDHHA